MRGRAVSLGVTYFLTVFEVDAAEVEVVTVTKRYDFFFDVFVVWVAFPFLRVTVLNVFHEEPDFTWNLAFLGL